MLTVDCVIKCCFDVSVCDCLPIITIDRVSLCVWSQDDDGFIDCTSHEQTVVCDVRLMM